MDVLISECMSPNCKIQSVQNAFRTDVALEGLAWLDLGQTAAKVTIMSALKVLYEGKQDDPYCKLQSVQNDTG